MRNTIVASTVAPLLMVGLMAGFVGCKSTPKMPWNRTAATADVESAAVAHSAPALPADIAKQAEALAASTPSIDLTAPQISTAPAYTPPKASLATTPTLPTTSAAALMASHGSSTKTSSGAYPTTGASPYTTTPTPKTPAATLAAATPNVPPAYQSTDKSANLGTVNMPYNPAAVPPAKTIASTASTAPTASTPSTGTDRYGSKPASTTIASAAPALNKATAPVVKTAAVPEFSGSSRYGRYGIGRTTPTAPAKVDLAATQPVAPSKAPAYNPTATATPAKATGDRYATTNNAAPSVMLSTPAPAITMPASVAHAVASTSVYRPGGTTSYAGLAAGQPAAEIATRPKPPAAAQTPSVTTPGAVSESLQAPRYR